MNSFKRAPGFNKGFPQLSALTGKKPCTLYRSQIYISKKHTFIQVLPDISVCTISSDLGIHSISYQSLLNDPGLGTRINYGL